MFRPKKHLKLDLLKSTPSIDHFQQALEHARKLRGCTIELPWDLEKAQCSFSLGVRIEIGSEEALWTLYTGEGNKSRVIWSAPFSDIALLSEVVYLSLSEVTSINEDRSSSKGSVAASPNSQQKSDNEKPYHSDTQELLLNDLSKLESPPSSQQLAEQNSNITNKKISQVNIPAQNSNYADPINSQGNIPAQKFYPNIYPETSGGFPSLSPPNNQTQMPYVYYYPGYPFPIPVPYPPGMPPPQTLATSVPLQQQIPVVNANESSSRLPAPDMELLQKKTKYLIGQFLVDSGLIPEPTLKTALKLQEMVLGNVISAEQAYEAINKFHKTGNLDMAQLINQSPTSGNLINEPKQNHPLIGDLLVKAQVLNRSLLDAVLKMQEIVRAGAITKDEACQAIIKELARIAPKKLNGVKTELEKELLAVDLLLRSSLISLEDKETALAVQKKHGGQLGQILVSAGKLHLKTYLAALEGETMLRQNKIKLEQVIIALNYCARTRMSLSEAIQELDFITD